MCAASGTSTAEPTIGCLRPAAMRFSGPAMPRRRCCLRSSRSLPWRQTEASRLVRVLGNGREAEYRNAFVEKLACLLAGRLAPDSAGLGFPVVDLAGLLGEFRADVLQGGNESAARLAQKVFELRRRCRRRTNGIRLTAARGHVGRHDGLAHIVPAAVRAGNLARTDLGIIRRNRGEPSLELVAART